MILIAFVAFRFYASEQEGFILIGRYVEPIIPIVLVLGIISINNMKVMDKKHLYYFIGRFITILTISLFTLEFDLKIIEGFQQCANNPALYYLEPLYHIKLPEILVSIYALAFLALMCLSIKNKAYINDLLILVILSALIPSLSLYAIALDSSVFRENNNINLYLNADTNKTTQLYIDTNMSSLEQTAGLDLYAFWNNGKTGSIYGDDKNLTSFVKNNNTYLITVNPLPYREITNDEIFRLYQL